MRDVLSINGVKCAKYVSLLLKQVRTRALESDSTSASVTQIVAGELLIIGAGKRPKANVLVHLKSELWAHQRYI